MEKANMSANKRPNSKNRDASIRIQFKEKLKSGSVMDIIIKQT